MSIFKILMEKPWLPDESGVADHHPGSFAVPNQKVGLVVFLAIVAVLFFLFGAAYHMRIALSNDWVAMPEPPLLWMNTGVLVLCSVIFEIARGAAHRGRITRMKQTFFIAGGLTLVFLTGQLVVWNQLVDVGYLAASNPANAFFYMITGTHAVHLLGGLVAWGRAAVKMGPNGDLSASRTSVDVCALYWHFLLLVWLVMFALLLNT
ncbi:MAG: cytochrome c oxidase subunit 3 [Gammaproteobacteria bacterium]|nr:cytochrome c oxidase subunit 3 [Gammaproteobacteria bacterium]